MIDVDDGAVQLYVILRLSAKISLLENRLHSIALPRHL